MSKLISASLSLALVVPFASAQVMGSSNAKAPTVKQAIAFAGGDSIELGYKSITWAQGRTMGRLQDKERGAQARQRINAAAEQTPLGSLTASAALSIGGKEVAAGSYQLFFQIDDDLRWHLVLAGEGEAKTDWVLDLKESGHESTRLTLSLVAGEADDAAVLYVAFGKQSGRIEIGPGGQGGEAKKEAEPSPGKGK